MEATASSEGKDIAGCQGADKGTEEDHAVQYGVCERWTEVVCCSKSTCVE